MRWHSHGPYTKLCATILLSAVALTRSASTRVNLIDDQVGADGDRKIDLELASRIDAELPRQYLDLHKRFAADDPTVSSILATSTDDPDNLLLVDLTTTMESLMHLSLNASSVTNVTTNATTGWQVALDTAELVMTAFGLAANLITFIALGRSTEGFSKIIRILLMHQTVIDFMVCVMAIALLKQPYMWLTGILALDYIICQAWHGQALYWGGVLLSVWNLVFIAVERFITVCKPFHAPRMKRWHVFATFAIMYLSSIVLLGPAYLQVRLTNGTCLSEYYFEGPVMEKLMTGYGIFWFMLAYAIPCTLFCIFYTRILVAFRQRKKDPGLATSRIIDNASTQLTKTAVIVTIVFIVSLGWDSWTYILGYMGVVEYEFNSPTQKIGVFLSVMNSCANPFIYAASMPVFRASLKNLFSCKRQSKEAKNSSVDNTMSVSTISIPLQ